jgi:VanZ family protein
MITTLAKFVAWTLAGLIVLMSLGPVGLRPQFGHPQVERYLAYVALGAAFSIAYPRHRGWVALAVLCGALGLEAGQLWFPGRHARVADVAAKAFGAVSGVLFVIGSGLGRDPGPVDADRA